MFTSSKSLQGIVVFLFLMFSVCIVQAQSANTGCNRIDVVFMHDYEPVMKVRAEVVGAIETHFKPQPGIDDVTMSVIGNTARITLRYDHDKLGAENVEAVYLEVKNLMKQGKLPDYVEGPLVGGCGVQFPQGKEAEQFKVFKSLEEALKTPKLVRRLDLHYQKLEELPASIAQLENLEWLRLESNRLVTLPAEICTLKKLKTLNLEKNSLTSIPEGIAKLSSLTTLILEGNELTEIPESIGQLKNLKKLILRNNDLLSLPSSIGNLESLVYLDASYNQLPALPESLGNLDQVGFINLNRNKLKNLPSSIGKMSSLKDLYASSNLLKGVPDSMKKLKNLTGLYLEINLIPTETREEIEKMLPHCTVKFGR